MVRIGSCTHLQDKSGRDPFPDGPFPSDGGRDENATIRQYKQTYKVGNSYGMPSRF